MFFKVTKAWKCTSANDYFMYLCMHNLLNIVMHEICIFCKLIGMGFLKSMVDNFIVV